MARYLYQQPLSAVTHPGCIDCFGIRISRMILAGACVALGVDEGPPMVVLQLAVMEAGVAATLFHGLLSNPCCHKGRASLPALGPTTTTWTPGSDAEVSRWGRKLAESVARAFFFFGCPGLSVFDQALACLWPWRPLWMGFKCCRAAWCSARRRC